MKRAAHGPRADLRQSQGSNPPGQRTTLDPPTAARIVGARAHEAAAATAADDVDDQDGEHQRSEEAGARAAARDRVDDDACDEGAGEADGDRLRDRHRVAPREGQAGEGAHDQALEGEQEEEGDQAHGCGLPSHGTDTPAVPLTTRTRCAARSRRVPLRVVPPTRPLLVAAVVAAIALAGWAALRPAR